MPALSHPHQSSNRQPRHDGPRAQDGFTLIEVLIAAVVLVVGLMVLFGLLDSSVKATAATRTREGATSLAREILEDTRTLGYSTIGPSSIVGELQAMHGLQNTSGGTTWQIARRDVTYTVLVTECAIDDPKDGWGKHVNAFSENPFCKDPGEQEYKAGEAVEDSQSEDLKRITAEVTWIAKGRKPVVRQVETLTSAGGKPGLNASGLKLAEPEFKPATSPIVWKEPATGKLVFSVQSPTGTTGMQWSLDGVRQENEPELVKTTEWRFSWAIPLPEVSDGTYQVGVQAVDATGVHGPPISIPVTLIRSVPAAPKVSYGGFNEIYGPGVMKVVELQWQPDSERNVIGYRVYNPSGVEVCPGSPATLSLQPSCIDFLKAPGSPSSPSSTATYSVVALYHPAAAGPEPEKLSETISPGPAGTFTISKTSTPNELGEKAVVKAEKNPEGPVILKWTAPAGGVPVAFYRIYRGSTNYTERYGVASAASTEFTDNSATSPHQYWVTAVSETMTESAFAGPVGPL